MRVRSTLPVRSLGTVLLFVLVGSGERTSTLAPMPLPGEACVQCGGDLLLSDQVGRDIPSQDIQKRHPPTAFTVPIGRDWELLVLDLYPHRDHVHVGSVSELDPLGRNPTAIRFIDDERLLLVAEGEEGRASVQVYNLLEDVSRQVLELPGSASHPLLGPGGEGFSLLRTPPGEEQNRIVVHPSFGEDAGEGAEELALPELSGVEAYAWAGEKSLGFVREGSLFLADLESGEVTHVRGQVGAVLESIPDENAVSFVDQSDPDQWFIGRMEGTTGEVQLLVDTPPGSEEHAWLSSVTVLMSHDGIVYRYSLGGRGEWIPMADLRPYIGAFERMAIAPSGLRMAVLVPR